ncbi:hypothetical protein OH687_34820 [Burkholderia anthina]|nr:hypothetical protein OH687_34820 [Burkholderia anthina]
MMPRNVIGPRRAGRSGVFVSSVVTVSIGHAGPCRPAPPSRRPAVGSPAI